MTTPLSLDPLLSALREAGLPVGVAEIERLHRVFALIRPRFAGDPDEHAARRHLRAVLRALLVKTPQDRLAFERIFDTWLSRAEQEWQARLPSPEADRVRDNPLPPPPPPVPPPPPRRYLTVAYWIAAALLLSLLAMGVYYCYQSGPTDQGQSPPKPKEPPPEPPPIDDRTDFRQQSFNTTVPQLTVIPAAPQRSDHWPWAGAGLALLVGIVVGVSRYRRLGLSEVPPLPPLRPGPPRVFPRPPPLPGPQLLDARQQEILVWGIGRFVSEEPSPQLDLPATVDATARSGGVLALCFQRQAYQREVWLWVDEAATDLTLFRLADEVETTLRANGLVVERALFRGIPDYLVTPEGVGFAPRELDERRALALVAVLTDGRLLTRQYAADDRRLRIAALLRELSHWPQLAFVDFSGGVSGLPAILQPQELTCITPVELAAFLGDDRSAAGRMRVARRDDRAWAAACALAPDSVDEAGALAVRKELRLTTSPWALQALQAAAPGPAGRLRWPIADRIRLLNWLRQAEGDVANEGVVTNSLLDQALNFWEGVYQQERENRQAAENTQAWQNTPAYYQWSLEYHLLVLWHDPTKAIEKLYQLFKQGRWQETIKEQLSHLDSLDGDGKNHIQLPWRWDKRSANERKWLAEMGFGGRWQEQLRRPGRLWLGVGACAGLAVAAGIVAWQRPPVAPVGPPVVVHGEGQPNSVREPPPEQLAADRWHVAVATPQWHRTVEAPPAAQVKVAWQSQQQPCIEVLPDGAELWRCGRVKQPPALSDTLRHRLVVLMAAPKTPAVDSLAVALLTGGSADVVLIDPAWPRDRQAILGRQLSLDADQQLLVLTTAPVSKDIQQMVPTGGVLLRAKDWTGLERALRFQGVRPVAQVWPTLQVLAGEAGRSLLGGIGGCLPVEVTDNNGMKFVRPCPGSFLMGSNDYSSDEQPIHEVQIAEFAIGKYEVTFEQYDRFAEATKRQKPDDWKWGRGQQPVINVTWNDAKAFCEYYGYRLPTEAEWEYAARAGTKTRYSFGDEDSKLGEYAWYEKNSNNRTHPVGQKEANSWGLHDMHGNVWEWVQDCYHDNYQGAPVDGSAWEGGDCQYRVLRGGSFAIGAEDLRSSNRNGYGAEDGFGYVGFRCVLGPRRQPF